ncbi:MAG: cytochrome c biogenesis protein ResB [Desulfofustis sp.]|nr:cytochrome c biogenesis protein ResB [Desulfofustis sp.]NNK14190.1 cytochrome c biogenesis protein ResB [Desulfofustis sp.]NNK57681.1 cytochrome c biogenesis protein ResB [Desulfofustis sp.]
MQNNNSIWQFFSSVKLALVTLFLIAVTSIIGTVIPQKEAAEFYVSKYGPKAAQIFTILDIPDMYNSWWFLGLLFLLGFNLIICSIDRFPAVWKQVTADGLALPPERLQKMSNRMAWSSDGSVSEVSTALLEKLKNNRFSAGSREHGESTVLFSQKGPWTRTGVYFVHASILVIFIGAIIGSLGGYKGSVMIPETQESNRVFLFGGKGVKELDFTVRCNKFKIDFYANGMPKEYTSSLTVFEQGKEVLTKVIEVNDPLTYKGVTFYQSSYEPYQDFVVSIKPPTGEPQKFIIPFQQQEEWSEQNLKFGVINAKVMGQSIVSSKLWFNDGSNSPESIWIDDGAEVNIEGENGTYTISAKQMYATGLQVARDPGVWWVYIGFGLMLFGLYVAFFMSHRRFWLLLTPAGNKTEVLLSGSANKNRAGFKSSFEELGELLKSEHKEA